MTTPDFFRARLDTMIDMRHPLAVLAARMPWPRIEAALEPLLAHMIGWELRSGTWTCSGRRRSL